MDDYLWDVDSQRARVLCWGGGSAFQPRAPGPPAASAPLLGIAESRENKASVRISGYNPLVCNF